MLHAIKKFIPNSWLNIYHRALSSIAAFWFGNPSKDLIVIGVTGTNGKTTTAYMISKALESDGSKTGCTSTALFKVADKEWLNDKKMTMLGRFQTQKLLRQMVEAGCKYAVVETSSQGVVQHRHKNIAYDICVFTNLTPEHIEAHGGFENYKKAKIELFAHTAALPSKIINNQTIPRAEVLNRDDIFSNDFALAGFSQTIWYGAGDESELKIENLQESSNGISFEVAAHLSSDAQADQGRIKLNLHLLGQVNAWNALAALSVAYICGQDLRRAADRLTQIQNMPGRFERIDEGQPWKVIVDYAPEPESVSRLYESIRPLGAKRIIHVLGSCGGGRDIARRPVLGELAGKTANIVIITNEDPYDDDPMQIINQVADGAKSAGKILDQDLFIIPDRFEAILKAMRLAQSGDIVLLTGKGCEQFICVANGKKIPWDERAAARQAIRQVIANHEQKV